MSLCSWLKSLLKKEEVVVKQNKQPSVPSTYLGWVNLYLRPDGSYIMSGTPYPDRRRALKAKNSYGGARISMYVGTFRVGIYPNEKAKTN